MSEEGRRKGLSVEEVLAPNNFLAYVGATVTILRTAGRRGLLPFLILGVLLAVVLSFALDLIGDSGGRLAILYLQLLALPLLSSLLVPRVARVMAFALRGDSITFREAGRDLRGTTPHVFAGGMIAALLALLLTQMLGLLGALIGWHLAMGPPVFAQIIGLERRSMQEAFPRTRQLAKGSALRVFLYLLCAALALVMFETVLSGLVVTGLGVGLPIDVAEAVFVPVSGAVTGFGLWFMCAMGLVTYFDMRTRAEDFDVDDLRALGKPDESKDEPEEG